MAEILASAFTQALFQNMITLACNELAHYLGVHSELQEKLQKLEQNLPIIHGILSDADERQNNAVKSWLGKLRDLAYDANDVLDDALVEAHRRHSVHLADARNALTPVNLRRVVFDHRLNDSIRLITDRLEDLEKWLQGIKVLNSPRVDSVALNQSTWLCSSSPLGLGDETRSVVQALVSPSELHGVPVLPIIGMGGLGKTRLAQLVYNDALVETHFDLRLWVHVSQDFNISRITKAIIESIDSSGRTDAPSLGSIQKQLVKKLSGRTYLMVLDDVWNESRQDWETLRAPLLRGAKGSRILVTTRSRKVADLMGTVPPYYLQGLSDGDCWSLFCKYAFDRSPPPSPELTNIRREIVTKCNRLPLAAMALGSRLKREPNRNEWIKILQKERWDFSGEDRDISRAVSSSYHHLHSHLKPCFAYCAVIPKGYEFEKEAVVHWWMAQNFIEPESGKRIEDTANGYFDSLVEQSFIRFSHFNCIDRRPRYTMHNVIHDFVNHLSADECCVVETTRTSKISDKTRHLALIYGEFSPGTSTHLHSSSRRRSEFETVFGCKGLYTLIVSGSTPYGMELPNNLASRLMRLRTLDLSNSGILVLPKSIGNLKHLRCLRLCNTDINELPESIGELYNLQILALRNCYMLQELPKSTKHLHRLRHLDLHLDDDSMLMFKGDGSGKKEFGSLQSMPPEIGALTDLQTLSRFVISRRKECGLREMQDLNDLHGELRISNLHLVMDVRDAVEANLSSKANLEYLELRWSSYSSLHSNLHAEKCVIEGLKPHTNLKELHVVGYSGERLPSWIGLSSFSSLVTLRLFDCNRCETLPPLGQLPVLKDLFIKGMSQVRDMNCSFCGDSDVPFPSLEKLHLERMPGLRAWHGGEECGLLYLHELTIKECTSLEKLAHKLPSLTRLEIEGSPRLLGLPKFPSLHNLKLKACGDWIWRSQGCLATVSSLTLARLPSETFPPVEQGALASLRRLEIAHCDSLTSLLDEWLPHGLTCISIRHCPQLKCLPIGIQSVSALEDLEIQDCKQLSELPNGLGNLVSLVRIEISDCPLLQSLPSEGLPAKLKFLSIDNCPALARCCRQDEGKDWHKITRVSLVWIDKEMVSTNRTPHASYGKRPQYPGQSSRK